MMTRKLRVLWVGESTFLSTGYATLGLELLKRLHASGKYELHELGCYGHPRDERARDLPWGFTPAMPDPNDARLMDAYRSDPANQFGAMKFEEACLGFKAECVIDCRDNWMMEHQERSPFRPFFRHLIMPTVDAEPQDEQWLSTFTQADGVFTYTDWGAEVLKRQGQGRIPLLGSAPPGADLEAFKPVSDRAAHRETLGINPDALVVGTVMRNQARKLYPDLIEAFAKYLTVAPSEMAAKTFLYMHTTWPDVGWDIPRLVLEAGVGHKCLFTYACRKCGAVYPSFFTDAVSSCRRCGQPSATFPSTSSGISRGALGSIVNLFDTYVQYANSEGLGMPAVEAAACGVPVMAVDYSGMSDVVRKLGGVPIRVQRMYREPATHCKRALPDNDHLVAELIAFFRRPVAERAAWGRRSRLAVECHYTYDQMAAKWMDALDRMPPPPLPWDSPPRIHTPENDIPPGLSDEQFVEWGMYQVAGRPELARSFNALRMAHYLNCGFPVTAGHTKGVFGRDEAYREMRLLGDVKNHWEKRRCGL